jgi:hypothetical protein
MFLQKKNDLKSTYKVAVATCRVSTNYKYDPVVVSLASYEAHD